MHQTQEVHEQIADLIEQLRRLTVISISLETKVLSLDAKSLPMLGIQLDKWIEEPFDNPFDDGPPARAATGIYAQLSEAERLALLQASTSVPRRLPSTFTLNGETVHSSAILASSDSSKSGPGTPSEEDTAHVFTLRYQAVAASDRSFVRLELTPLLSSASRSAGQWKVDKEVGNITTVPIKNGVWALVPLQSFSKNANTALGKHVMLLVKPTIEVAGN